jgi:hypothetical protein
LELAGHSSTMLSDTILVKAEFWALVATSLALPVAIIWHLVRAVRILRRVLIGYSILLMVVSGLDVILIKAIALLARQTSDLADDKVFLSEYSLALYLLPLITVGVGVNLLTYTITRHLRITSRNNRT